MIPSLSPATAGGNLSLSEFVDLARRSGFSGVEFSIQQLSNFVDSQGFEAAAALFEASPKVLPVAFGLPLEWRKDEATFHAGMEQLSAFAKLAQNFDCTRCTTYILPENGEPLVEYSARSIARFGEIGKVLADQGVRFGLEFIGPQHFRSDTDNSWFYDVNGAMDVIYQVENQFELQNLGLLIDTFHWFTAGNTMMDLAAIPLEKIVHVHVNDAPDIAREAQIDNVRLLPGKGGAIDITGFLSTLNALGYDGPVAVETFSAELNALAPEDAAGSAAAALNEVLRKAHIEPLKLL